MSIHKLTAGSGYDYLTRQVAAMDATEKGHTSLATYYTDHGETPGQWMGSGMAGIDGLDAGNPVTAEQMKALFGYGFHPLADARTALLDDTAPEVEIKRARQLGTPFKVYEADVPPYRIEVARRLEDLNVEAGRPREAPVSLEERAQMRTVVAREYFMREHDREPADARELASAVALYSRPKTTAVAGYDLTFSPVKSVSTLWAVADLATAAAIERAHNAAVRDALAFLEREALYTRVGTNGVQQVDVHGLVATAFTHRDSRAGDPDLHTHVAVANKVQTVADDRWLAIDGRLMFKATVAASETYNTALERHLETTLGVRFEERENTDRRKRPVREIVGVDPRLNERWSTRRQSIEARRDVLVAKFHHDHGRPPTAVEAVQLAQQATLETRNAKHEPRSLPEQRAAWAEQAASVLGPGGAEQMVATALRPPPLSAQAAADRRVDAAWVERTASRVVGEVQGRQSTWQRWHLIAEAERHVRGTDVLAEQIQHLVGLVEDQAISLCQPLTTGAPDVAEPQELRRLDGSSVYDVAGSTLYTSPHILEAEERIVEAAGHHDRRRVAPVDVDLALLESTAHGVELNAGQAAMVRGMATSGARVQLGIAAAGTGKTTTMSVLTRAWENTGGNVIGLAPSAAAAAALREQTGTTTDTLAKLVDTLRRGNGAGLLEQVGPETLVIIDEAGMADTLSLDAAITAILDRGASVRLIGDDQQLAAIGAGGVLRDIGDRHGSLKLAELMRFSDPAEGAATLAMREGLPEAFGYYFDCQRIHVGDVATLTDDIFTAWHHDRTAGKDAVMLAPTRDLVAELNSRARTARLTDTGDHVGRELALSDGNNASVGDMVLTRHNDRRLRVSASDWVKNGDRWTIEDVHGTALRVRHVETGLRVLLPPAYVAEHTELGYASTVHTAQGISADTMHGLITGDQTRQQLYTMMSRGRHENHAYVVVASDGDPHGLIRPEALRPPTAGDVLTSVLARDESPRSATSMLADANSTTSQLRRVTEKYADAIYAAAADYLGMDVIAGIEAQAEVLLPGLTEEPAWPALRSHLLLLQSEGSDAVAELADAIALRDVESADDRAAVLDWRLDPTGRRDTNPGPLPWLPATPAGIAEHPTWGPYLGGLDERIRTLAAEVHSSTVDADSPLWARHARLAPAADVAGDVAVWRAATGVAETDRRPTGPRQLQKAAALHQRGLEARLNAGRRPAMAEWGPAIHELHPRTDSFTPLLAERLAAISRSGVNAADLLAQAAGDGPLPDEHVAAALWWRIARHLTPAVAAEQNPGDGHVAPDWSELLLEHFGVEEAAAVTSSPWWPTLVATIDQAHDRGWPIEQLLDLAKTNDAEDLDLAQAMIWRIALVTDPPPEDDYEVPEENLPPEDLHELESLDDEADLVLDELAAAARDRDLLGPAHSSSTGMGLLIDRAWELQASPVPVERVNAVNAATADYFEAQFPGSWARLHVHERLGVDLARDERFRPGYAPPGWTNLIDHLRTRGFTDEELVAAGVAKEATTGRLIDRFRDRAILPVITNARVIGFVGRRNPDDHGDLAGPKYLNSPDTIVFHKGAQLYGIADDHMAHGAIPVLVEGPFDAIAVTVASGGAFLGVAPLGTSTTAQQAAQLAGLDDTPLIATDGDLAGRIAAERDLWLLAPHLVTPRVVPVPVGADPAGLLEQHGPAQLVALLQQHRDLPQLLINERLTNLPDSTVRRSQVAEIIAVTAPARWHDLVESAASTGGVDAAQLRADVVQAARSFNHDPQRFSADKLDHISDVRRRLEGHDQARPADRWASLGRSLDPRLTARADWPATAALLQELHTQGTDVERLSRQVVAGAPLGEDPSRDLRYRLVEHLEASAGSGSTAPPRPSSERKPSPRPLTHRPDSGPHR